MFCNPLLCFPAIQYRTALLCFPAGRSYFYWCYLSTSLYPCYILEFWKAAVWLSAGKDDQASLTCPDRELSHLHLFESNVQVRQVIHSKHTAMRSINVVRLSFLQVLSYKYSVISVSSIGERAIWHLSKTYGNYSNQKTNCNIKSIQGDQLKDHRVGLIKASLEQMGLEA